MPRAFSSPRTHCCSSPVTWPVWTSGTASPQRFLSDRPSVFVTFVQVKRFRTREGFFWAFAPFFIDGNALGGCTTLRPIGTDQSDLSLNMASGKLLKVGDHVVIGTNDRQTYEFVVTSFSATSIDGKSRSIPIDQVASLEKRVLNGKKTLIVVGSILLGVAFTVALAHAFQGAAAAAIFRGSN